MQEQEHSGPETKCECGREGIVTVDGKVKCWYCWEGCYEHVRKDRIKHLG